jgi:CBS-domain-containing membrane protein
VVDADRRFQGTISRSQLLAQLGMAAEGGGAPAASHTLSHMELLAAADAETPEWVAATLETCAGQPALAEAHVDLGPYVNASAFSVRSDFSLHRAYMIFRTMGLRHLIITDVANEVVGVLTRKDLMDFRLHAVLHAHDQHGHGTQGGADRRAEDFVRRMLAE